MSLRTLVMGILHAMLVQISGRFPAAVGCLVFVALFSFGQLTGDVDNYSYVCPYSHEMTHGLALSVSAILCVYQYVKHRRMFYAAAAGLAIDLPQR